MNKYYEIDEKRQKQAREMWSFSDYVMGSITEEYKQAVDKAYSLAEQVQNERREYAFELADKYAKKLAEYHNKSASVELMCPSIMICGAGNFPVKKKEKQNNARRKLIETREYIDEMPKRIERLINYVPVERTKGEAKYQELLENEFFKVIQNEELNRIQLIFDGKPDDETRALLKLNAFKWSPTNGAWQRQLTGNARYATQQVIKAMQKARDIINDN